MIKIKLCELLGKHRMNQKTISKLANMRPATISKMYYGETKRITIEQLNSLCKSFDCEVSELFEYILDEEEQEKDQK